MMPDLSPDACLALRTSYLDDAFVLSNARACNELVDKGLFTLSPHGHAHLTTLGARWLLAMLVEEEMRVLCRCGLPRAEHAGPAPHDAPQSGCRAFTPASPVYTLPRAHVVEGVSEPSICCPTCDAPCKGPRCVRCGWTYQRTA